MEREGKLSNYNSSRIQKRDSAQRSKNENRDSKKETGEQIMSFDYSMSLFYYQA